MEVWDYGRYTSKSVPLARLREFKARYGNVVLVIAQTGRRYDLSKIDR